MCKLIMHFTPLVQFTRYVGPFSFRMTLTFLRLQMIACFYNDFTSISVDDFQTEWVDAFFNEHTGYKPQ